MNVRTRLYAAMVVVVVGFAVTVGVGVAGMTSLGDSFDRVQEAGDARALALALKYDVTDMNGWQTAYGYDNGASRPTFLASVERLRSNLAEAMTRLARPEEQRSLADLQAAFDDFMRLDDVAWAALQAGREQEVRRIFLEPEIVNFTRAAAAAEELASLEAARADREAEAFRDARRDALQQLLLAAALAGLLILMLLVTAVDVLRGSPRPAPSP
ncbi:MAG: hypothetical protein QOJ13_1817 [Gaiellales bacterium]|nr:hypothetical protein [Gaiellales bacterium]MDX6592621.1 hypothetical protein [Gaiellales bacterium]